MNDGMCDRCGRRIPTGKEMYFVRTDYGEECYCEKCAIEYVRAEKTDAEILDKMFIHRTVGCDG